MRNYFSKLGTQVPWRTSRSRGATLALPLRYLSALFLLLTLAIGQMWGALTAHVPGVYEKSVATGGYGCTLTTIASGTDAGTFEVYYFSANSKYGNTTDVYGGESKQQYRLMCADDNSEYQLINTSSTSAFTKSCDWIEMDFQTTGFAKSDYTYSSAYNEFFAIAPNGGNASNTKTCYIKPKNGDVLALKVSGYEEFAILAADNGSSKYMTITVDGGTPTSWKSNTLSRRAVSLTTGEHTIVVANVGTSANNFYGFSLKLPSCSTEITTQPSGATLAVGDANPTLSVVATNAASYAWKESSDGTSYNGASTLGTSASFTPSVNDAVQTKYYYCEVTSDCDGTTVVKSNIVTVNVVGAISYYTVTLNPAGGTIVDATGWTSKDGNYEKEVAEGTELTLPIFTKTGRTFKTWRKAGPVDVASPVTVDGDLSLTAIWTATIEQVIYSWVGAEGGAIETGGTAAGNVDNLINQPSAGYYCLKIDGNNSYSANLVTITLAGEEKVKTGDKIKYWGFYVKDQTKSARPKMRDANSPNASIFDDPDNLPNLYSGGDPAERTFTVPASINTNAVQLTRSQTGSNTWISKLQIIREVQVEEGDLLTVTFDANGGSAIAPVVVASGQAVAKPADPTKAHNRFNEWQLSGSTYNFSTPVTASITLEAVWTPLYTVTYAANGGSGTMTDANEYAAGDEVTLLANTFDAPDASYIWDSWAVTDASDNPVSVSAGKFAMPNSAATVKAQWATISDFDVKFFQGYGDPDVQIGITQSVSTGNYATAPAEDPGRTGYRFLGWSYDATVEHIVNVSEYAITATTNFTAMWIQQFAVTFDGAGEVLVDNGATVASPNSPSQAGKIFQGWYNAEVKYDFSAAVTGNLALTSKWADADPNHYVYAYNDDFHFDGVVYKTPEGVVDGGSGTSNITMTTPYTLFAGAEGITSIVITDGIYDSKTGAIQAVTALMKVNNNATSKLTVTIKSGYTATLKIKSSGYSATRTINVSDAIPASGTTTGQAVTSGAMSVSGIGELSFALNSGSHDLTVTGGTLYIAELDIEATALPAHTVTYMPGEGTGAEFIIDDDATEVSDGSTMFTAPAGKIFHGWKDALDNDVAVGAIVEADMTLTAQWIAHYAVTFDMQGHGTQIVAQDIVHGSKAVKPADPVVMGWDFGGWFTDAECTAGNEFDFETPITAATPLFAKWTEFEGCALLYPALSGDALHVGDNVAVQTGSKGGVITIVGMKTDGSSIAYNANGLYLNGGGADVISVTLNSDMAVDTKISVTLMAANTGERGLNLLNATGGKVKGGTMLGWADATLGEVETFSYTVEAEDGLEGTNIFRLQRNNSVYLQCIKVESCGSAVVYHNLTSAVNIAGKGTVTLGASSVREGYTTTATYSDIDEAYEFDTWLISGTGASIADASANPAVITMGTADAVVTLKLKAATPKHTVSYNVMGHGVAPADELVKEGDKVTEPIIAEPDGWIFEGWYKENKLDNEWDFDVDVMSTGDITLYAKWVEDTSIRLLDGSTVNHTNFITGVTASTVNFDDADHNCAVFGDANVTDITNCQYLAAMVQYNARTNKTKVKLDFYSVSGGKKAYLFKMVEGGDVETIEIDMPTAGRYTTEYYTFDSESNRSIYVTVSDRSKVNLLQMKVIDNGETTLKRFGEAGYSLNLNKSRLMARTDATVNFEGMTVTPAAHNRVNYSTYLSLKSDRDPVSFTIAAPVTMTVVNGSSNKYYVSTSSTGSGDEFGAGSNEFDLTAGTWYIVPKNTSAIQLTSISFTAPKCEKPAIVDMSDVDLCENDPYTALMVSASVSDGGTLHYAWFKEAGATDEAVGTDADSFTPDADGEYYVIVTNQKDGFADNTETSNVVTVQHLAGTTITTAPVSVRKDAGESATLSVVAAGKNLAYEWFTCNADGTGAVAVDPAATEASLDVIVPDGEQYYKVVVTGDCGTVEAIAKVEKWVELTQQDVTETTLWDFSKTGVTEDVTIPVTEENPVKLLANIPTVNNNELFRSDNIVAGDGKLTTGYIQTQKLSFHATVPGYITVTFSNTGNKSEYRYLVVNGVQTAVGSKDKTAISYSCAVQAGDVELTVTEGNGGKMFNFRSLKFEKMDYFREIRPGYYGTICLEHGGKMYGAALYEVAYFNGADKIYFDEIIDGTMEPGMPYIFQSEGGSTALAVAYSEETPSGSAKNKNGLYGSYTQELLAKNDGNYVLLNNQYLFVNSDEVYVGENRAYIRLNEISTKATPLAPGRRRIAMGVQNSQVATGMENLNAGEAPMKVMINGQLFILRGENMFDATGRLVK